MKNVGKTQRLWLQSALAVCLGLMTIVGTSSNGAAQLRRGQVPAGAGTIFGQIVINLDFHPTRTCNQAKFMITDSRNITAIVWAGVAEYRIDARSNTVECVFDAGYWPIAPGPVAVRAQIPCTSLDATQMSTLEPYDSESVLFEVPSPLSYNPNTCE